MSFAQKQENPFVMVSSDPTENKIFLDRHHSMENGSAKESHQTAVAATANIIAVLTSKLYIFRFRKNQQRSKISCEDFFIQLFPRWEGNGWYAF